MACGPQLEMVMLKSIGIEPKCEAEWIGLLVRSRKGPAIVSSFAKGYGYFVLALGDEAACGVRCAVEGYESVIEMRDELGRIGIFHENDMQRTLYNTYTGARAILYRHVFDTGEKRGRIVSMSVLGVRIEWTIDNEFGGDDPLRELMSLPTLWLQSWVPSSLHCALAVSQASIEVR